MEHRWILPVSEYYARLNAYILEVNDKTLLLNGRNIE
jgi:hypothetical protein